MRKKFLSCMMMLSILMSFVPYTTQAMTNLYYDTSNDEVTIIGCDSGATTLDIPSTIDGYPVTAICSYASFCDTLTSITIPNSVTRIDPDAFLYCKNLSAINVDSTNPYYSSVDGVLFDKNKTRLVSYPKGKKSTEYIVPDGVKDIECFAFSWCDNLTSIIIPEGVTSIGEGAFHDSPNLETVKLPNSVTSTGPLLFAGCSHLKNVNIPNKLTRIELMTFFFCSIESITIPNSVTSIGAGAFDCCRFTTLTIPNSVTNIDSWAFQCCGNLISIVIPDSVKSIGEDIFSGCENLKDIYYTGSEDDWKKISGFENANIYEWDDYGNCIKKDLLHYNYVPPIAGIAATMERNSNDNSATFDITLTNYNGENVTAYAAMYDSTNKLTAIAQTPVLQNGTAQVTVINNQNNTKAKVFVWNENMLPFCPAKNIPKTEWKSK